VSERIAATAFGAKAHWPSGFQLYQRGAPADGVFIVLHGHVVLRSPIKGGRGFVSAIAMAGETFGAEGLANNGMYVTDANATEGAETLHLGSTQFRAFVREQPAHALALVAQLMAERTTLLERLQELAAMNVEERLVSAILRLGDDVSFTSEEGLVRLESSHHRLLCEMVGATRESITLALSRMIASGAARRAGSTFMVDPRRLTERARAAMYDSVAPMPVVRDLPF
jgi:CRP-like cAMP-binding protein